jgi:hypothetical protein
MEIDEKWMHVFNVQMQQITKHVSSSYLSERNWVHPEREDDARRHQNGTGARTAKSFALSKMLTQNPSKVGPYPSDLHETECKTDGNTRPVVPVMAPRPENVK